MDKEKMVEELLEKPYRVVDFLPEQVPEGSAGQFFAVEKYYMNPERMKEFRRKFADILLKLNCYYNFSVCEAQGDVFTDNPDPEWLEGKVLGNADLCVLLPEEETTDPRRPHFAQTVWYLKAAAKGFCSYITPPSITW